MEASRIPLGRTLSVITISASNLSSPGALFRYISRVTNVKLTHSGDRNETVSQLPEAESHVPFVDQSPN